MLMHRSSSIHYVRRPSSNSPYRLLAHRNVSPSRGYSTQASCSQPLASFSVFSILLFLAFKTISSPNTGGLDEMYRLLVENAITAPIVGNGGNGSYLTFKSLAGFEFAMINLFANMGLVVLDVSRSSFFFSAGGSR